MLIVLAIVAELAPLETNNDNLVRVNQTRVIFNTVVAVFKQGTTAEETTYRHLSLKLANVCAVSAFYLNYQQEVEAYLQQRQQRSQEVRRMNQARYLSQNLQNK